MKNWIRSESPGLLHPRKRIRQPSARPWVQVEWQASPTIVQARIVSNSFSDFSYAGTRNSRRQSHESTKSGRDGLPLSYGQFDQSASANP